MISSPVRPVCASIFFLHRFSVPDLGVFGHDPTELRGRLEYLRKHRYQLLGIEDLIAGVEQRRSLSARTVVFTVDDGYADFAAIAAPIFAAYDCPVTVFLITDFVAGRLWNWWDKVEWAFRESPRREFHFEIANAPLSLAWSDQAERMVASETVVERLKRVPDTEKESLLAQLALALDVSFPTGVPQRDGAMTWNEVRRCAAKGATFGPHTVTHPILSQVSEARARDEIFQSWHTVKTESNAPVPVFCYPNGTPADFSGREESAVAEAGMKGALSTVETSIRSSDRGIHLKDWFAIPRFNYPDGYSSFVQIVSGLHSLRETAAV